MSVRSFFKLLLSLTVVNLLAQEGEALGEQLCTKSSLWLQGNKAINSLEVFSSVAEKAVFVKFCKCKIPMGLIILFSVSEGYRRTVLLQSYL